MVTKKSTVLKLAHENFRSFRRQRAQAIIFDAWMRGHQGDLEMDPGSKFNGKPYIPSGQNSVTDEYQDLVTRTPTPWGGLVVSSLAQTTYLDGVRRGGKQDNLKVWNTWQMNGWDAKQIALSRAALGHGVAWGTALPGRHALTGEKMAVMRGISAKRMAAFYDEDYDEWPAFAIEADKIPNVIDPNEAGWTARFWDETAVHYISCKGDGEEPDDWEYISYEPHPAGVTPVVRFSPHVDLDGRATGLIEPIIPLLRRIDQDTFDRLIVQRFGAWKVRYIAGLAKPKNTEDRVATAMRLKIEDLLVSGDPNTKFGTLDETQIDGFIKAKDADLRDLSAVAQIPPHHLLGLSSNLQAESLAAAESGLQRHSGDVRMSFGESYEQYFRLVAKIDGTLDEARAYDMQVRWRDTESRSFVQTANALSLVATSLKVPVEMLWEKIPGWTDFDTERAKELVKDGAIDALIEQMLNGNETPTTQQQAPASRNTGGSDNQ